MMRLDKMLANMGAGTRSQVKKAIRDGRVQMNGEVLHDGRINIDPSEVHVLIDGKPVVYQEYRIYMMNKPAGTLCVADSSLSVMNLVHEPYKGLFPCGRLDKDTEGLLLIMNDGQLAHQLLSPKKHVDKTYYVELQYEIHEEDIKPIASGSIVDGADHFAPGICNIISSNACTLTIHEGKYHEVKRIFHALGNEVTYLKRIQIKGLKLDDSLKPGEYRELTEEEENDLRTQ